MTWFWSSLKCLHLFLWVYDLLLFHFYAQSSNIFKFYVGAIYRVPEYVIKRNLIHGLVSKPSSLTPWHFFCYITIQNALDPNAVPEHVKNEKNKNENKETTSLTLITHAKLTGIFSVETRNLRETIEPLYTWKLMYTTFQLLTYLGKQSKESQT